MYSTDHNEILHTSRQHDCRDVQIFFVIILAYFELQHSNFLSIFEFDQNTINRMGTGSPFHTGFMDS